MSTNDVLSVVTIPLHVGDVRALLRIEASAAGIRTISFAPRPSVFAAPAPSAPKGATPRPRTILDLSEGNLSGAGEGRNSALPGRIRLSAEGEAHTSAAPSVLLCDEAECQLADYLRGERRELSLPVDRSAWESASPFRQAVWEAIVEIPYGHTATYADIARRVGNPRAVRAVGSACRLNFVPLLIPCHRVVPSGQGTGAYAGGADLKAALLALEHEYLT